MRFAAGARPNRRLIVIFLMAVVSGVVLAGIAVRELQGTSRRYQDLLRQHVAATLQVERIQTLSERLGRLSRSYHVTGDEEFLRELERARQEFHEGLDALETSLPSPEGRHYLAAVRRAARAHGRATDRALDLRRRGLDEGATEVLERHVMEARSEMDAAIAALAEHESAAFHGAAAQVDAATRRGVNLLLGTVAAALVLAGVLAWTLGRTLRGLERSRGELAASLRRLESVNRDLDAFAGRIAHDLRNVLAPLALTAQSLRRSTTHATAERCAERLETVARRASGLLDALLAFARAGRPTGGRAAVRPIVEEVLESHAQARSLADAEVSCAVEDVEVRCAPSLLYAVIGNLVSNAFKYVEGSARRQVRISARRVGPLCEIVVEDSGPGIAPERLQRIFEPFYRAPDARAPGTGIGLATVQRIVEAHEGRIAVRSAPGEGAAFVVRLPLAEEQGTSPAAEGAEAPGPLVH